MDLSKISTKDLEYAKAGQWDKVSQDGLEEFARQQGVSTQAPSPSVMSPVEYSPVKETARSIAGGMTFNFADELEAALRTGSISSAEYTKLRDQLRAQQGQFAKDYPVGQTLSELGGSLAMPGVAMLKPVTRGVGLVGDVALGTGMGALTGLGQAETMDDALNKAALGGMIGAGGTALLSGVGRALAPNVRPEAAALREQGIPLTPGSAFGGKIQQVEQAAESIPILGGIVSGARERQFEKFNEAAYNKVLSNIDPKLKVPQGLAGRDAYLFVNDAINQQYNSVIPKLSVKYDSRFESGLNAIKNRYSKGKLPPKLQEEFNQYVEGLRADFSANQVMNGTRAQTIKQDLSNLANSYQTAQGSERLLANAYRDLEGLYMNLMKNQNPKFAKELSKADSAYRDFVRVRNAMSRTRGEDGIFTPAQLESAVRQSDKSAGKGAFARGQAPMQDLASSASSILGNKVPDSGTAMRGMTGAALTGGAAWMDPTMGGLTALMTAPYYRLGEKAMFAPRPETFTDIVQRARAASPFFVPGLIGATE